MARELATTSAVIDAYNLNSELPSTSKARKDSQNPLSLRYDKKGKLWKKNGILKELVGNDPTNSIRRCRYVGLRNLGATCYMNSFLQYLHMNTDFSVRLLRVPRDRTTWTDVDKQRDVLIPLQNLFGLLQDGHASSTDPSEVAEALKIETGNQEDATEFATLLLTHLEEDLRKARHRNIVPDLFKGTMQRVTTCRGCKTSSHREEDFSELRVSVPAQDKRANARKQGGDKGGQQQPTDGERPQGGGGGECGAKGGQHEGGEAAVMAADDLDAQQLANGMANRTGRLKRMKANKAAAKEAPAAAAAGEGKAGGGGGAAAKSSPFQVEVGLNRIFDKEALEGDNQYECGSCEGKQDADRYNQLTVLPPYLHVCLERYAYDPQTLQRKKVNTSVEYPEYINVKPYVNKLGVVRAVMPYNGTVVLADGEVSGPPVTVPVTDDRMYEYDLIGVLEHHGQSAQHGHYTAILKDLHYDKDKAAASEPDDPDAPRDNLPPGDNRRGAKGGNKGGNKRGGGIDIDVDEEDYDPEGDDDHDADADADDDADDHPDGAKGPKRRKVKDNAPLDLDGAPAPRRGRKRQGVRAAEGGDGCIRLDDDDSEGHDDPDYRPAGGQRGRKAKAKAKRKGAAKGRAKGGGGAGGRGAGKKKKARDSDERSPGQPTIQDFFSPSSPHRPPRQPPVIDLEAEVDEAPQPARAVMPGQGLKGGAPPKGGRGGADGGHKGGTQPHDDDMADGQPTHPPAEGADRHEAGVKMDVDAVAAKEEPDDMDVVEGDGADGLDQQVNGIDEHVKPDAPDPGEGLQEAMPGMRQSDRQKKRKQAEVDKKEQEAALPPPPPPPPPPAGNGRGKKGRAKAEKDKAGGGDDEMASEDAPLDRPVKYTGPWKWVEYDDTTVKEKKLCFRSNEEVAQNVTLPDTEPAAAAAAAAAADGGGDGDVDHQPGGVDGDDGPPGPIASDPDQPSDPLPMDEEAPPVEGGGGDGGGGGGPPGGPRPRRNPPRNKQRKDVVSDDHPTAAKRRFNSSQKAYLILYKRRDWQPMDKAELPPEVQEVVQEKNGILVRDQEEYNRQKVKAEAFVEHRKSEVNSVDEAIDKAIGSLGRKLRDKDVTLRLEDPDVRRPALVKKREDFISEMLDDRTWVPFTWFQDWCNGEDAIGRHKALSLRKPTTHNQQPIPPQPPPNDHPANGADLAASPAPRPMDVSESAAAAAAGGSGGGEQPGGAMGGQSALEGEGCGPAGAAVLNGDVGDHPEVECVSMDHDDLTCVRPKAIDYTTILCHHHPVMASLNAPLKDGDDTTTTNQHHTHEGVNGVGQRPWGRAEAAAPRGGISGSRAVDESELSQFQDWKRSMSRQLNGFGSWEGGIDPLSVSDGRTKLLPKSVLSIIFNGEPPLVRPKAIEGVSAKAAMCLPCTWGLWRLAQLIREERELFYLIAMDVRKNAATTKRTAADSRNVWINKKPVNEWAQKVGVKTDVRGNKNAKTKDPPKPTFSHQQLHDEARKLVAALRKEQEQPRPDQLKDAATTANLDHTDKAKKADNEGGAADEMVIDVEDDDQPMQSGLGDDPVAANDKGGGDKPDGGAAEADGASNDDPIELDTDDQPADGGAGGGEGGGPEAEQANGDGGEGGRGATAGDEGGGAAAGGKAGGAPPPAAGPMKSKDKILHENIICEHGRLLPTLKGPGVKQAKGATKAEVRVDYIHRLIANNGKQREVLEKLLGVAKAPVIEYCTSHGGEPLWATNEPCPECKDRLQTEHSERAEWKKTVEELTAELLYLSSGAIPVDVPDQQDIHHYGKVPRGHPKVPVQGKYFLLDGKWFTQYIEYIRAEKQEVAVTPDPLDPTPLLCKCTHPRPCYDPTHLLNDVEKRQSSSSTKAGANGHVAPVKGDKGVSRHQFVLPQTVSRRYMIATEEEFDYLMSSDLFPKAPDCDKDTWPGFQLIWQPREGGGQQQLDGEVVGGGTTHGGRRFHDIGSLQDTTDNPKRSVLSIGLLWTEEPCASCLKEKADEIAEESRNFDSRDLAIHNKHTEGAAPRAGPRTRAGGANKTINVASTDSFQDAWSKVFDAVMTDAGFYKFRLWLTTPKGLVKMTPTTASYTLHHLGATEHSTFQYEVSTDHPLGSDDNLPNYILDFSELDDGSGVPPEPPKPAAERCGFKGSALGAAQRDAPPAKDKEQPDCVVLD
ncbi:unnamed protein product [Vitrella brassicaformis CCMP3155]|uniref:ubiquitinyl hydrolase 1 n=7 Tax=Vitrella brassicaformis TaxID=1169539 RepID=A0A0G4F279_VITBC|nr:unnamed protein product [Vitrella brassicaformis CCMP3155]|eukprot:CEM05460.1 unnamed protein product [Vitrella brassicaformis CCMP3155]